MAIETKRLTVVFDGEKIFEEDVSSIRSSHSASGQFQLQAARDASEDKWVDFLGATGTRVTFTAQTIDEFQERHAQLVARARQAAEAS